MCFSETENKGFLFISVFVEVIHLLEIWFDFYADLCYIS